MKLQQLIDDARTLLYEAVRDEILSLPSKTYAAIAYEYGTTQVTVWKIAKTYGISRPRGRKPKNHFRSLRILVVDAAQSMAQALTVILTENGHDA